jgi:hypothetical protein
VSEGVSVQESEGVLGRVADAYVSGEDPAAGP